MTDSSGALGALLGNISSKGVDVELMGGLNFTGGLIATPNEATERVDVSLDAQVRNGFRGVYYVDPLSTAAELGSEYAPFHSIAAATAYALSQGITSGLIKIPPGAAISGAQVLPTSGTWEIESESTTASATITGNITVSNTGGASYIFSRVTINGNISGANSGSANSFLFLRSTYLNGSITLTKTGAAGWTSDYGGVGGNFIGNSGYVLNAISVAGGVIAENFSFFGDLTYTGLARFAFVGFNANVDIIPNGAGAGTVMIACNFAGGTTIAGVGSPTLSVDGHTLAGLMNQTASTAVSGVLLKTNSSNGSVELTGALANSTSQFLAFAPAGIYTARAIAFLTTTGGVGTLLVDINYVDSAGNAKTIAVTTTGLNLAGTAGTEDAGTTRNFYHNGSAAITYTVKGITTPTAVRVGVACRREN